MSDRWKHQSIFIVFFFLSFSSSFILILICVLGTFLVCLSFSFCVFVCVCPFWVSVICSPCFILVNTFLCASSCLCSFPVLVMACSAVNCLCSPWPPLRKFILCAFLQSWSTSQFFPLPIVCLVVSLSFSFRLAWLYLQFDILLLPFCSSVCLIKWLQPHFPEL